MTEPGENERPYRYAAARTAEIEARWQQYWKQHHTYAQPNPGEPGFDAKKPKFYALDMFPYPSGAGLHVGHPEGYTATDIVSRYKRMRGFNVLHPMGWDAFGLPAEQYAIQTNVHPSITTRAAIETFRAQLQRFGFSYDWSREFGTIDEGYYRFTQWLFLQFYGSWFDRAQNKGRPLTELIAEFTSGQRAARFNPDGAEISLADKAQRFAAWPQLDAATQRRILDSWRLAYVAEQVVNWCPKLGTVLANEEVIDGRSERGGFPVLRKPLKQWMLRITAYAERLLEGLRALDWPESTKAKQTGWIGRSEGAEIDFALERAVGGIDRLRVFTTRPDTLFGATYMVVAPEHALVSALLAAPAPGTDARAVGDYVQRARNRSDLERQQDKTKSGVPSGLSAVNPATGKRIPIWIADYVLMGYGHGAIMAVPAHDERDFEFAKTYGIDVVQVVEPLDNDASFEGCLSDPGRNINSKNDSVSLDGLDTASAQRRMGEWLEKQELGRSHINYKLRDWLFSRQRYWGEPFPIVFDAAGNHYAVDPSTLPLKLPELADFKPEESDDPKPLLAKATAWMHTTAGAAGVRELPPDAKVTREANTMPNWAGSCWYYLRFCDPKNQERLVGVAAEKYFLGESGVDLYIGGAEHGVLHLLYARFWHQLLHDLGYATAREPFHKLFHQGLITSHAYQRADKTLVPIDQVQAAGDEFVEIATGEKVTQIIAKMSKSLKNVVNPDDVVAEYGADTFRLYEMYMGPLEASKPWNTRDISGLHRFLQRAFRLLIDETSGELRLRPDGDADAEVEKLLHRTTAKVQEDIERLAFNTAIAALIKLVNEAGAAGLTRDQASRFARLLAPFTPHVAEELWSKLGEAPSVATAAWPAFDPAQLVDDTVQMPIAIKGKVRSHLTVPKTATPAELEALARSDARVQELLVGKTVHKVVVVPGRMINFVAD